MTPSLYVISILSISLELAFSNSEWKCEPSNDIVISDSTQIKVHCTLSTSSSPNVEWSFMGSDGNAIQLDREKFEQTLSEVSEGGVTKKTPTKPLLVHTGLKAIELNNGLILGK
ncbi:hypothetical protein RF11_05498 [Thelohanellus kitauei]|uniref:Ig-like domain-containing protein n=1 Tax=Thelohanellus kitauei TaxID=669202 RepID=A0A0C2J6E5_THEKT|nr:hypothetical protein RF11_05498 [Thelohanellus kitauei]